MHVFTIIRICFLIEIDMNEQKILHSFLLVMNDKVRSLELVEEHDTSGLVSINMSPNSEKLAIPGE